MIACWEKYVRKIGLDMILLSYFNYGCTGKTMGTFVHETADVKVIVNANRKVVTVIPK